MAKIKIPENYQSGIEHLSLLDEQDIKLVYNVLDSLPIGIGQKSFLKFFNENTKFDNNIQVAEAIFSFSGLLIDKEFNIDSLSKEIADVFSNIKTIDANEAQVQTLETRVREILQKSGSLKTTFEAHRIIFDSNKVYINSEINSDINMIYEKDSKSEIKNGVLMHKLKLETHDESDNLFITMDRSDLQKLKSQIESALIENEAIKNNYKDLINFVEITE